MPSSDHHALAAGLTNIKETLGRISDRTENDFVDLGSLLQQAHDEGRDIEQKARHIVALADGEQGKSVLLEIRDLIRVSRDLLTVRRKHIVDRSDSVRTVMGHLKQLQSKNADIERLAKYLRAVALNIFIETSRSQAISENFSIIATEIKQLSETILTLSKTIRETVIASENRFSLIYTKIKTGLVLMERLTGQADHSVAFAMTKTDDWLELVGKTAAHSVESQTIIIHRIGQIVMSLQFHDAMRQRLEHIGTGIEDMVDMCTALDAEDSDPERDNRAMIHALSGLLSDQLGQIIVELTEVYDRCSESFDSIKQQMTQVEQSVRDLTGGDSSGLRSDRFDSDAGGQLVDSLSEFMGVQNRGEGLIRQMNGAYAMVSETASSLSDQIGEIHQISMDAHIKALNAIIAATHLGHEGKTLAVLAGEMKSLSDLTEVFVGEVEETINDLVSGSLTKDKADQADGHDTGQALGEVIQTFPHLVDQMKEESAAMHEIMARIRRTHEDAMKHLAFMPDMVAALTAEKKQLVRVNEDLAPFRGPDKEFRKIHERLEQRYTMEKERLVHQKSLSGAEVIEDPGATEDLDDNIELF